MKMTGPEVMKALSDHAYGRHSKGQIVLNGADVKTFVEWIETLMAFTAALQLVEAHSPSKAVEE